MKRILTLILAVAVIGVLAAPVEAAYYFFQVRDEQGRAVTSGFKAQIYTVASRTQDALFSDVTYSTLKTNPVNPDANGVVTFATSASTVDVLVYADSGNARGAVARVVALTDKDHTIILDTQKPEKQIRFYFDADISRGAAVDTGIDLPKGAVVNDVWIEVATGFALSSVSVGLLSTEASGDTDGFCVSQGIDQTWGLAPGLPDPAFFRCEASRTMKSAADGLLGNEGFHYSSNTRGVLLASFSRGQNTFPVTAGVQTASHGVYQEYRHFVRPGAATSIVYMTNDRQTTSRGAAGWVSIFYHALREK
ncbi:MAG TPA: hypothetical protein DCP69_09200 [Candidatus Omnitrophica bacterium]|nr:hypothetical protein [Candidatus Omnitrophota bacterium]